MEDELDEEMPNMASTENIAPESHLNSKEGSVEIDLQVEDALKSILESMDHQVEVQDATTLPGTEYSDAPKDSAEIQSDHQEKNFCEQLLGELSESQYDEIEKLSTTEGVKELKEQLENAIAAQQNDRLCMLLAQCWKANINIRDLADLDFGIVIRELKKNPDKDVKAALKEVIKKWKTIFPKDFEPKAAKWYALKLSSIRAASPSTASLSSEPSTSSMPIIEKKKENVKRSRTSKVKLSKPRLTGFEDPEEEPVAPPVKKAAPTTNIAAAKENLPEKTSAVTIKSNSFAAALSTASNVIEPQRKRKESPPLPVVAAAVPELAPEDPFQPPKKKICFADEKGLELVRIKYIESDNKGRRSLSDMKNADEKGEGILLKQSKFGVEEEDGDNERTKTDVQNGIDIEESDDYTWENPICYSNISDRYNRLGIKLHNVEISKKLINEENIRCENVMRTFVFDPDFPIEHPDEPDILAYAQINAPENIPVEFIPSIQENMEADEAVLSNDIETDELPSLDNDIVLDNPAVFAATVEENQMPPSDVTNSQIIGNFDAQNAGHFNTPNPAPKFPFYSVPPSLFTQTKSPPQPVPAPSEEQIMLANQSIISKQEDEKIEKDIPSTSSATVKKMFTISLPNEVSRTTLSTLLSKFLHASTETESLSNDLHDIPNAKFGSTSKESAPSHTTKHEIRQQQMRPMSQSGQNVCPFFLKGTCTFGNNCRYEHSHLDQQQSMKNKESGPSRSDSNKEGQGSFGGYGRFNSSGFNKAPLISSKQNSNSDRDENIVYQSRKRKKDKSRGHHRSPSPERKRRRHGSREETPEKCRRNRSRSPKSRSSSSKKKERRRKHRSPSSRRAQSPPPERSRHRRSRSPNTRTSPMPKKDRRNGSPLSKRSPSPKPEKSRQNRSPSPPPSPDSNQNKCRRTLAPPPYTRRLPPELSTT